jgi:DNA-binding transcriptional LysR family regulator
MDAADLRVFQSVAGTGSMNKAALELNTVQSNVTARIKALEDEVGFALFERTNRGGHADRGRKAAAAVRGARRAAARRRPACGCR